MYTIRVEGDFAAAHFLKHYHGKCENFHGHNYKVRAYAEGATLDAGGMLYDFAELKKTMREVLGELDHTLLNENPHFREREPSAELIASHIFKTMKSRIPNCPLSKVDVFETDRNMAGYQPD